MIKLHEMKTYFFKTLFEILNDLVLFKSSHGDCRSKYVSVEFCSLGG